MPSRGGVSDFDVVVIGAGPAGEAAAELGGILGYSVALVERDAVGGTVVTSGGAPTGRCELRRSRELGRP
jgi:pyruvate/2-oxoglutarate dehydrogenase complex dihydrolipoamide dehydrogenase (E3) component